MPRKNLQTRQPRQAGQPRKALLALTLAGAAALTACGSQDATPPAAAPAAAGTTSEPGTAGAQSTPFGFTAQTVSGESVDTSTYAGRPTVLWFWAPWCTICRVEGPKIAELADQLGSDVQVVGVAGRGEVPAMKDFVDATGVGGFTQLVDADGSVWASFGVVSQPSFAFVGADGTVRTVQGSLSDDDLREAAEALKA